MFTAATHPAVRVDVSRGQPLQYRSGGWDFGWFCETLNPCGLFALSRPT